MHRIAYTVYVRVPVRHTGSDPVRGQLHQDACNRFQPVNNSRYRHGTAKGCVGLKQHYKYALHGCQPACRCSRGRRRYTRSRRCSHRSLPARQRDRNGMNHQVHGQGAADGGSPCGTMLPSRRYYPDGESSRDFPQRQYRVCRHLSVAAALQWFLQRFLAGFVPYEKDLRQSARNQQYG